MTTTRKFYYYRLALTEAGLEKSATFFIRKLPPPRLAPFNDHTVRRTQSTGGTGRFGYSTLSFLWLRLDSYQALIIDELVLAAEVSGGKGSGILYATVPKTIARPGLWIDVSGVAPRPNWAEFVDPDSDGRSYANVRWDWNNCTIINEPSTVL